MTVGTFLVAISITAAVLIVVRLFWEVLLLIGVVLYILGYLAVCSTVSALLWVMFVSQTAHGWGWLWLYFFLTYSAIVSIYALIAMDIYQMARDGLRDFIKSTR